MSAERKYDRDDLVPKICARLAEGVPLTVVCRDLGVGYRSVNLWRNEDPEIDAQFEEARAAGADSIASRTRHTAHGRNEDGTQRDSKDTMTRVQRDRLAVETDLKLLAKWDKRYSEKIVTENTNHTTLEVVDTDEMDRRLDRAIAAACEAAGVSKPQS